MQTECEKFNNSAPYRRKATASIKLAILLAIIILPLVFCSQPTYADTADPDTNPTLRYVHVNRNLYETGDMAFYGLYDIPYATLPTTPSNETFIFRLMDTDGITELGQVTPFSYFDTGYNEGIVCLYFSATDDLDWGSGYIIRLSENPSKFDTPESYDYIVSLDCYSTFTTQSDNQGEMADKIIEIARLLENYHDSTLLSESGALTILSADDGESYFRGAISGLQALAPDLFLVQSIGIDLTSRTWTTAQFDTYEHRFDDTWVGDAQEATADQFGISQTMVMGMIIILPICLGLIIFSSMKFKRSEPGLLACTVILMMGVTMGWMPKAVFASIFQVMGIYTAYIVFYARG